MRQSVGSNDSSRLLISRVTTKLYLLLTTNMMKQRLFSINVFDNSDNRTRERHQIKKYEMNS